MEYNTVFAIILGFLGMLDSLVYGLVSLVLTGLYNIAETKIFTESSLTDFTNRIYVILGIFMLFKLAFSLLTSIVNPDKANDKQAGMQKIIVRVVITLSLLLMVPSIFQFAYQVQGNILKALPQIILGPNNAYNSASVGDDIAMTVMTAFIDKNECGKEPSDAEFHEINDFSVVVSKQCSNSPGGKKIFEYRYIFLISTVVGIIMIVFLVLTTVDVAIRLIKLSILQIISPIPIMTYIDPKSEKDGAFGNWVKECIQTYISLFIQMAVIYVIIYLIAGIAKDFFGGNVEGFIQFPENISPAGTVWVFIFIVIGAFFFMRQAPKYIMKVLGIKEGIGLGIGLNAGLAGLGAAVGGAGLYDTTRAITESLDEGATANAEGKSASGGLQKGRDIAEQFKTGDPKAKAKTAPQRFNDWIMAKKAASLGFTKETVADAKTAKFNAADAASNAQSLRSRFQNVNGDLSKMEQSDIDKLMAFGASDVDKYKDMSNEELVDAYVNSMNTKANKASSYYDKAVKFANTYGVKTDDDLYDEFNPKYKAKTYERDDNRARHAIEANRNDRISNNDKYENNRGFNPDRYDPEAGDRSK